MFSVKNCFHFGLVVIQDAHQHKEVLVDNFFYLMFNHCLIIVYFYNFYLGFEHVFCGEFRDTILDGHHSWISYYLAQQRGDIEYYGYYTFHEKLIGTFRYSYKKHFKKKGGFFFRTSPGLNLYKFILKIFFN